MTSVLEIIKEHLPLANVFYRATIASNHNKSLANSSSVTHSEWVEGG